MRLFLVFGCLFFLFGNAKSQQLQFYKLKDLGLTEMPAALGKLGPNYFFLLQSPANSEVYVLDEGLLKKASFNWPIDSAAIYASNVVIANQQLILLQELRKDSSVSAKIEGFNENGLRVTEREINLGHWYGSESATFNIFQLSHSKTNQYHLFFRALSGLANDSLLFKGVLLDRDWNKVKDVTFLIPVDPDLEFFAGAMVDDLGAIHLFSTDFYDSYRLSIRLKIRSVPKESEFLIADEVVLKSKKIEALHFSEDAEQGSIKLQAIYSNSESKKVEGVMFLTIPLIRGTAVLSSFYKFDAGLVKQLLRYHSGTPEKDVLQQLVTLNINETDSGTVFSGLLKNENNQNTQHSKTPVPKVNSSYLPSYADISHSIQNVFPTGTGPAANGIQTGGLASIPVPLALLTCQESSSSLFVRNTPRPGLRLYSQLVTLDFTKRFYLHEKWWQKLTINNGQSNAVLLFNKNNYISYLTYLDDENARPYLAAVVLKSKGVTEIKQVKLPEGRNLVLSRSVNVGSGVYVMPAYDEKTGDIYLTMLQ